MSWYHAKWCIFLEIFSFGHFWPAKTIVLAGRPAGRLTGRPVKTSNPGRGGDINSAGLFQFLSFLCYDGSSISCLYSYKLQSRLHCSQLKFPPLIPNVSGIPLASGGWMSQSTSWARSQPSGSWGTVAGWLVTGLGRAVWPLQRCQTGTAPCWDEQWSLW